MDRSSEMLNVSLSDSSHADSSVLGAENVEFFSEPVYLGGVKTGVAEHANLAGDVVPVLFRSKFLSSGAGVS
jgi:hypothetical protein